MLFFFFFKAEDGIRYLTVTGVQTCALPISRDIVRDPAAQVAEPARFEPQLNRPLGLQQGPRGVQRYGPVVQREAQVRPAPVHAVDGRRRVAAREDRKSTRLNSSHSQISYAVFCLK